MTFSGGPNDSPDHPGTPPDYHEQQLRWIRRARSRGDSPKSAADGPSDAYGVVVSRSLSRARARPSDLGIALSMVAVESATLEPSPEHILWQYSLLTHQQIIVHIRVQSTCPTRSCSGRGWQP